MRYFDYDNEGDDEKDDIDNFFGENSEKDLFIDLGDDLEKLRLNQKMLKFIVKTLEKSFFWKFKSNATKIDEICNMYLVFSKLTKDEEE